MVLVSFQELKSLILGILLNNGVPKVKAELLAIIIAESTLDGVNSHGINRLPLLVDYIQRSIVKIDAEPEILNAAPSFLQVDGHFGFGILNAVFCTQKAIELADNNGIGLVALKNTNHWHRAGTYGWQAANEGKILICWTNTIPIVPPYGSKTNLIGNNPFVIAIPRGEGHIVLDMATSQYSYGKISIHARTGEPLPEFGGYDQNGLLTNNAADIKTSGRHLPIGFWKGSGLTFILDMLAAILSGGNSTTRLGKNGDDDTGMSQVFIAIDPAKFGDKNFHDSLINETINQFREYSVLENASIKYPGEDTLKRRNHNSIHGIPVEKTILQKIKKRI